MSAADGNWNIFFYEAFAEEAERLLFYANGTDLRIGHSALTLQEIGHSTPPAPIISLRTQSVLPPAWAPQLGGILSRSTGYDHMNAYRALAAPGCPALGYLPLYCARAVAEQALLLTLALLRRLPQQLAAFERFQRDHLTGQEIAGKTLALFGVGNIGHEIGRLAASLGLDVLGVDPVQKHADITYTSPAQALAAADIIVCAMNLTAQNHGYFTRDVLAQATRRPLLVNIARGEFTPATALEEALAQGTLSGVALDVFHEEAILAPALRAEQLHSLTADNRALLRLGQRPDVLLTPHNAFNTREAVERKAQQSIQALCHFQTHGRFLWPVPEE